MFIFLITFGNYVNQNNSVFKREFLLVLMFCILSNNWGQIQFFEFFTKPNDFSEIKSFSPKIQEGLKAIPQIQGQCQVGQTMYNMMYHHRSDLEIVQLQSLSLNLRFCASQSEMTFCNATLLIDAIQP